MYEITSKMDVHKIDSLDQVNCWESNGTTVCGMMMWDWKLSYHTFRLLFKHGDSLYSHIVWMSDESDAKQILTASPLENWRRP